MYRSKSALGTGLLLLAIVSCATDIPTRETPIPETSTARTALSGSGVSGTASTDIFKTSSEQQADEQFNCTNVQHVQARFSSPGFVNNNVVGLYVEFSGFPDVNRTLRVWWDEENAPEKYEDVPLEDSDLWKVDDLMAFDKVVEHSYENVNQDTTKRVRVELSLADLTGNCARVRDVELSPPSAAGPAPPAPPANFTFAGSQVIDGSTVTCSSVQNTATYTQCSDLLASGRYMPNGITCGPAWSTTNSSYSDTQGFCQSLTGSTNFEVFYTCGASVTRSTWFSNVWGTTFDNGYTQHVRCYY